MRSVAARILQRTTPRFESPAISHAVNDSFGWDIADAPTPNMVADLMAQLDARISSVQAAYAAAVPGWMAKDAVAAIDWANDWAYLLSRYQDARAAAQKATTPIIGIPFAPGAYDALLKAARQSAPPDGGPLTKGDLDDLSTRLTAAGVSDVEPSPVQPKAIDLTQKFLATTAPIDVAAQLTGAEQPKLPGVQGSLDALAWVKAHKTLLLVAGGLVVGGALLTYAAPMLGLAAKGLKAASLGAL